MANINRVSWWDQEKINEAEKKEDEPEKGDGEILGSKMFLSASTFTPCNSPVDPSY
jgi:hypothetical protein